MGQKQLVEHGNGDLNIKTNNMDDLYFELKEYFAKKNDYLKNEQIDLDDMVNEVMPLLEDLVKHKIIKIC